MLEPPSVRRAAERNAGVSARLDQGPELPALEQLRQQAAPPAAPVPNPAPAPVIPAAPAPPAASAFNAPVLPAPVAPPPQPAQPPSTQSSSAQQQAAVASPAPPTPPAPVVVRPGLAPVANGRAMVQLAALSSEESARSEWERLQKRVPELAAFQSQITRFDRGEGQAPLYRLRAIGLANTAAARSLCEAMRAKAAPCTPLGG